jgi:alpha-amylase
MRFLRFSFLLTFIFSIAQHLLTAQDQKKVLLQAFWWDFKNSNYPQGWSNYLIDLAPRLRAMGIDAVWVPVNIKNANPNSVGYMPFDHYDLGDKFQKNNLKTPFGDKDEFLRMVGVLHANGIDVIQDIVLNHIGEAGSATGQGGMDPAPASMATAGGFKNFRYTSFSTPALNESADDYWTRNGRWPKNFQNFHSCTQNCNDINGTFWGPDIDFSANAIGRSSNIPASGSATILGNTRSYVNPAQPSNYMRNEGRSWMVWLKKQTGVDGWRLDAVKHFPVNVQEDYIYNTQFEAGFASGGDQMFTVGEWVGGRAELDAYVDNMQGRAGTFDFGLRGFAGTPGLHSMVYGMGNYNMATIPGTQQLRRNRTVPFVNNHDTFRPSQPSQGSQGLQANGNYPVNAQGNPVRWTSNSELSPNIDPREPRLAVAYAIICAVDGHPQIFFEDLFDVGTTGKRYTHLPQSEEDLPVRASIANIIRCHQKFGFKEAAYRVRTAETAVFFEAGSSAADLLIFERAGRAIIGVNDNFTNAQAAWIDTDFPVGTVLKDYSGNYPNVTVTTRMTGPGGRVRIQVPPCNGTANNTLNKGYAIYAPADLESFFNAPFNPVQRETRQEWEMADDLGDSHSRSLRQGGALPAGSMAWREVGKVYAEQGKTITYRLFPSFPQQNNNIGLYLGDQCGTVLDSVTGTGNLTKTFTPNATGWYRFKVRNLSASNPSQRVWVNITYTSPREVNALQTRSFPDPVVNLGPDRNGCVGTNINLNIAIDANHSYQWTTIDGTVLTNTSNISINQPGQYIAIATNTITGCSARDTIQINGFFTPPTLPDVIQSNDTLYVVNPQPGISYRWRLNGIFNPADTLPYFVVPANATNVALRVVSPEGCGSLSANLLVSLSKQISPQKQFMVFPNPATSVLHIESDNPMPVSKMELTDISGKTVNVAHKQLTTGHTIDMLSVKAGVYLLKIYTGSAIEVHKVIKQ